MPPVPSLSLLTAPRHIRSSSISSNGSAHSSHPDAWDNSGAPTIDTSEKMDPFKEAADWVSESTRRDPEQQFTISIGENSQELEGAFTQDKSSQEQRDRPEAEHNKDEGTDVEVQVSLPNPTSSQLKELADFFSERNMSFKFEKVSESHEQKESRPLNLVFVGSFTVMAILCYAQSYVIYKHQKHGNEDGQERAGHKATAISVEQYKKMVESLGDLSHLQGFYVGLKVDYEEFCRMMNKGPNRGQADPSLDEKSNFSAV